MFDYFSTEEWQEGHQVDDFVIHEPSGMSGVIFSDKSYHAPAGATEPHFVIALDNGSFITCPVSELS